MDQNPIVGKHLLGAIKEVLGDDATEAIINAWAKTYNVIAEVFINNEKEMYASKQVIFDTLFFVQEKAKFSI